MKTYHLKVSKRTGAIKMNRTIDKDKGKDI